MCELLGMNALHETDVNQSVALLRPRGGEIGPHADGWGLAFYEGRAARVFKEPIPAAESRCLEFIADYNFRSTIAIGHIRKANPPEFGRTSANTHPFSRELGGRSWVFAHNGKLLGVGDDSRFSLGRYRPIGDTDSEHAFCYLMDQLAKQSHGNLLEPEQLVSVLAAPVARLSELGEFNILLTQGIHLVAFTNRRLHAVQRRCLEGSCEQSVVVLATTPLTDENWQPVEHGHIYVYAGGEEIHRTKVVP